jgi:hypothetical protein
VNSDFLIPKGKLLDIQWCILQHFSHVAARTCYTQRYLTLIQGEALNRALLIKFLVQATLYLNCFYGSPEKGLYVLFMMFDTALFSATAARGDDRPQAAAERAAGDVHLYLH